MAYLVKAKHANKNYLFQKKRFVTLVFMRYRASNNDISIYKIYEENTIEVGVYIDRHLYKRMEEVLKYYLSQIVVIILQGLEGAGCQCGINFMLRIIYGNSSVIY